MNISKSDFHEHLYRCFSENGMASMLSDEACDKFFSLTEFMLEENEKYNLTAITEPQRIIFYHYLDCATLSAQLPQGAVCADVGCGAGFPTLPLAILRPDLNILGIDSTAKRTGYVARAAELLSLGRVRVLTARAEDAARQSDLRESFEFVFARAVANLRVLSELCLPLTKRGGSFIAMKGKSAEEELEAARAAIGTLGGRLDFIKSYSLSFLEETVSHPLIKIKKEKPTPALYPRPYAKILKNPL